MSIDWKSLLDEHHEALPILAVTTDLENVNIEGEAWDELRSLYRDVNEDGRTESRVMVSVINALLTQKRLFFCLARDRTQALVQTDDNHATRKGFDNDAWRRILSFLIKRSEVITCMREGKGRQPSVYTVGAGFPWLHRALEDRGDGQLEQCVDFVEHTGEFSPKVQTEKIKGKFQMELEKEKPKEKSQKEKTKSSKPKGHMAPCGGTEPGSTASSFWNFDSDEKPPIPEWLTSK